MRIDSSFHANVDLRVGLSLDGQRYFFVNRGMNIGVRFRYSRQVSPKKRSRSLSSNQMAIRM